MKYISSFKLLFLFGLLLFSSNRGFAQCTEAKDADMAKYKQLTETQDAQGCSQCAMLSLYFCSAKYCATAEDKRKVGAMITACKRNIQNMGQPYCCPELLGREPQWGSMVGGASSGETSQNAGSSELVNPLLTYPSGNTNYTNNEALNTATDLVIAAAPLINQIADNIQARREQEEQQRLEQLKREQEAAAAKAKWLALISNRKKLIAKFPEGKTPLSSQPKTVKEVFFFTYSYEPSSMEETSPVLHVSNVFSLPRYEDGTWPFKSSLMEQIQKSIKGLNLTLSGFYSDKATAVEQQQYLATKAGSYGFMLKSISYVPKKTNTASGDTDFWGNSKQDSKPKPDQATNAEKQEVKLDFWGNPIKE